MAYDLGKFYTCQNCGEPMIGIIKPDHKNQAPKHVAREECKDCIEEKESENARESSEEAA